MAYERKKPQIILLDRWEKTVVDDLTDEEAGKILKAMYRYFHHGEQPAFQDRLLRFFWEDVTKWLDDSREWYQGICDSNVNAGKASGESRRRKREQPLTPVNTSQQPLTPVNISQHQPTLDNIDNDKAIDNAIDNDNAQRLMPKAQGEMPKAKHSASDNDNHPSNIQSTSIITEGAGKSAATQPAPIPAELAAKKEAEALRVMPGNFKTYFKRAAKLDGETVFHLCNMRRDMIRQGADPAAVDRGIQKEIDNIK